MELRKLPGVQMPCEKLAIIMQASQCIYAAVNLEQNAGKLPGQQKTYFLSADDFLPVLIFVLSRSECTFLARTCEFLSNLCDPSAFGGEPGYYLTAFASAVQYIQSLKPDKIMSSTHV